MQAPAPCSVRSRGVNTEMAMILSLTPASSTSFKTTAATFLPVESELAGPQEGTRRHLPVRRTAMRSSVSPERDGSSFPSRCRTNFSGNLLVLQFHDLLGGLLSPRNSCSMDRALRDRHTSNVHSKNLSGSCER
ncbi:hypothetical protein GWK47_043890 [Chionoecetes opilio]|uniref:Uncharacterized protein n=1 Tax=Chionoecetes opilio TaxID=41210 RepID=A0A8J4YFQ6_CHIOP|nr:hypothetical protein GWK47_043890 [Chionoecetes opilio]